MSADGQPCEECAESVRATRSLVAVAVFGGILMGAGLAWLVLKK